MTINFDTKLIEYTSHENNIVDVSYSTEISHTEYPGATYTSTGVVPVAELLIPPSEFEERKSEIVTKIDNGLSNMMPTLPMLLGSIYRKLNGTTIPVSGLGEFKTQYKNRIDYDAEICRLKFITPGAGQAMTYQQKVEEARACLEDTAPTNEKYPMLAVELGITGSTLTEVSTVIIGMNEAWRVVGSQIEHIRLNAKKAVDDATDSETIINTYKGLVWPTP